MNSHNISAKFSASVVLVALIGATAATAEPTVIIANPMNGTAVSGKDVSVVISYSSPDSTIVSLDLLIDGQAVFTKKLPTPQQAGSERFSFDTTLLTDAVHTLGAIAHDAKGDTGNASVKVYVSNKAKDTFPPTVVITKPRPGATVSGTIEVAMEAHDNKLLQFVTLFIDDTFKFFGNAAPFRCLWDTRKAKNGAHTLLAKAYDGAHNEGVSPPVVVTVNNEGGKTTMPRSPFREAGQPPAPFKSAGSGAAPPGAHPLVKQPSSPPPAAPKKKAVNKGGAKPPMTPATPALPTVHLTKPTTSTPAAPTAPGAKTPSPSVPTAVGPSAPATPGVAVPTRPTSGKGATTRHAAPKAAAPAVSAVPHSAAPGRSTPAVSTSEAPAPSVSPTVVRPATHVPATGMAPAPGSTLTGGAPATGSVTPARTHPESPAAPVITSTPAKAAAPASPPRPVVTPPVSSPVHSASSGPGLTAVQVPQRSTSVTTPQPEAPAVSAPRPVRIAKLPPSRRSPAAVATSTKPAVKPTPVKPTFIAGVEAPEPTRIALLPPTVQATPPEKLSAGSASAPRAATERVRHPARAVAAVHPTAVVSGPPKLSTVRATTHSPVMSLPRLALAPTVRTPASTAPAPAQPPAALANSPVRASRASLTLKAEATRFPDKLIALTTPRAGAVQPDLPLARGRDFKAPTPGPATVRKTYTIRPGDNLSRIARRFNVSVVDIALSNNIRNPRLIRPGHQLIIPNRSLQVFYDNHAIKLDVAPFAKAGVPLAPFRPIFEHAGGTVVWVHQTKTVKAKKDDHTVQLKIGSRAAQIDGQSVLMELAALIKDSRTMVPTSLFAKTLDVEVRFDPETGSIMIASK